MYNKYRKSVLKKSQLIIALLLCFVSGFMIAFLILKAETKPFEVKYDDPIIRGGFVNYDYHDLTLTIETDLDYLNKMSLSLHFMM